MVRLLHNCGRAHCCVAVSFNPTMVRLLPQPKHPKKTTYFCFNPTMVRLLHDGGGVYLRRVRSVSIPQWCDCCAQHDCSVFERSVVSIPQWCDCCKATTMTLSTRSLFQSHNGAIAAPNPNPPKIAPRKFQSHNGAIAADWTSSQVVGNSGFNPTMVRLLH